MDHESDLFKSYFKAITLLEGGYTILQAATYAMAICISYIQTRVLFGKRVVVDINYCEQHSY